MKLVVTEIGPCGVYKLFISSINSDKDKQGTHIGFIIDPDDPIKHSREFIKFFPWGQGGWELDKFLKEVGLDRKGHSVKRSEILGLSVWGSIRLIKVISEEYPNGIMSHEIFEFNIMTEREIKPTYLDDPQGDMPKEGKFYHIIDKIKAVSFEQDSQTA